MLYATLNERGDLTITASEPIEAYALEAWEKARKQGKANLIIESGVSLSIEALALMLKKDLIAFRQWQAWMKEQDGTVRVTPDEMKLLTGSAVLAQVSGDGNRHASANEF